METATSKLTEHVTEWLRGRAEGAEYDQRAVYRDLMHSGCGSGMVGHLIYTHDCAAFYDEHQAEIDALLAEAMEGMGEYNPAVIFERAAWDATDPLARADGNKGLLAWFGFEETARTIALSRGWDE